MNCLDYKQVRIQCLDGNNKMNNKFYSKFKDLFVDSTNNSYPKQSLPNPSSSIPAFSSPYTIAKASRNPHNQPHNEMASVFRKYADRQMIGQSNFGDGRMGSYESVATRELASVILPKLKHYDQEIDKRLKRFKTQQHEPHFLTHNYSSLPQNNFSFLQDHNYSLIEPQVPQEHSRYKHKHKFRAPSNNIFHDQYQTQARAQFKPFPKQPHSFLNDRSLNNFTNQSPSKLPVNSVIHPKHSNNHIKTEGNSNSAISEVDNVNRSRIKRKSPIFYMKHNPEDELETEYQRSYSNKKLPSLNEQHQEIMRSSRVQENDVKTNKNQNKYQQKHLQQNKAHTDAQTATKKSKHHTTTEPSSPQQSISPKVNLSVKVSRKNSVKGVGKREHTDQQLIVYKQEGMKFSQYQNQYAFINRRLQDIYNFNNFYSHKYINSYKLAIMSRLEAKRKVQERRDRLKYILEKEKMEE